MPENQDEKVGLIQKISDMVRDVIGPDPFQMLLDDHKHVKSNFKAFPDASADEKYNLYVDTILSLVVHTKLEEELVYPLLKENDELKMLFEAGEEHRLVDFVITEMKGMEVTTEKFAAKFKVLQDIVEHHIMEEEGEMFPALAGMGIDLGSLAKEMEAKRAELNKQYATLDSVEPLKSPATAMEKASPRKTAHRTTKKTATKAAARSPRKSASSTKGTSKKTAAKKATKSSVSKTAKTSASKSSKKSGASKSTSKKPTATAKKGSGSAKKAATKKSSTKKPAVKAAASTRKTTAKSASPRKTVAKKTKKKTA